MRILQSIARDSKVLIMADARVNKKRSFDAAFKLMVVEYAEMNTNRGAATKYSVNEKQVRQWRMKKEDLKDLPKKKKRIDGGGRKPRLPDVETVLMAWIDELRAGHLRITCSEIQRKATELARNEGDTEFIASRGWLQKFFKRHQLSLRRKTSVSQKLPQDLMPKVLFLVFKTSNALYSSNDCTGGWIHHQDQETSTPQAILLGMHWQHGRDTTMDGHAW